MCPSRRPWLQRAFSTFPDGFPGAGLLLLRAAVGGFFLVQATAYLLHWHGLLFLNLAIGLALLATGGLLLIGYLTPFVCVPGVLFCVGSALSWLPWSPGLALFEGRLTPAFAAVIALALMGLGPGAYSLDARLFGRREIVIPATSART
jgi:uncharacterized membrane protein YphA (DoxX/SURF4 family)